MTNKKRNLTSLLTLATAAVLAIGATTALAATGSAKAKVETASYVKKHSPKLERKDRWQRKTVDFDCMWREKR